MSGDKRLLGTASDISQLATAATAIAVAIGGYLAGQAFLPPSAISVLGGMAGTVIAASAIWTWTTLRKRLKSRRTDWNPGLWMKSRSAHAVIKSPTEIRYHNRIVLAARQDDQMELRWRVGWTGGGQITPYVNNPGFKPEMEPSPADFCQILKIKFDRPLQKSDGDLVVEFGLITVARPEEPQQPFYSVTLYESRLPREAQITVEFDPAVLVKWVLKEVYENDTAPWPLTPPERIQPGPNRVVTWPLDCVRGRRYGLRWEYE